MLDLTLIPATPATLPQVFQARHLIGGHWCDSADGAVTERCSPAHGVLVSRAARGGEAEAGAAIAAARAAFDDGRWSGLPGKDRAAVLLRVADRIEAGADRMALIETLETGKPITQARAEVAGAADLWRYAAALARTQCGDSHNGLGPETLAMVLKEPIGVVSIITPWNFPFWILSQKLPFALAAGCTCVVKPSELTPSTTVMLGELLGQAGLPDGVVNIVLGLGQPVGAALAADARVDMVTFTGSTAVGRGIAAAAGATLKKVALELGGKNPQVIFPDADLEAAADAVVFGLCFNAGQCCNSGSRVLVHADIAEAFTARVTDLSRQVAFGDPLDPATQVGAIVSPEHAARIDGHVTAARAAGACLRLGGAPLAIPGLAGPFYPPTVLTGIRPDMAIARDEVFGPVLAVLTFGSLDEALALVNDADYGLSAGVWSGDVHTCLAFARGARAGTVWTNTWMDGFPEVPFGGVRQSGLGREIGRQGLEEFLEIKSVVMRVDRRRTPWTRPR
ncbi:MAG: aldehyde dehydrogenase family protein [Fuscovulum sp.]|jgi:betaine-aldehyde dehydrogenase|nr:aldehyde dehydrogenase family protein [Fuscovulum sp.]